MKPASPPVLRATRLLDQVRERIRYKHYSLRTEQAYVQWVRIFVKWHGLRHPRDMGQLEIEGFLAMLANERRVAAATHNQALSALLFLYREVLGMDLPWLDGVQRPRTPKRIPSVLTVDEVAVLLSALPTDMALLARLLYGTGMRLMEGLRLRVKDVDFDRGVVVVRQAKGDKDRVVMLPRSLAAELRQQVLAARAVGARLASAVRWRGRSVSIGEQADQTFFQRPAAARAKARQRRDVQGSPVGHPQRCQLLIAELRGGKGRTARAGQNHRGVVCGQR